MFLQRPTVADGFDWSLTLPSNLSHKGTPTAPSSDPTIGRQSVGERPVAGSDEGPSIATGLYRILTPRSGGAWGQRGCVVTEHVVISTQVLLSNLTGLKTLKLGTGTGRGRSKPSIAATFCYQSKRTFDGMLCPQTGPFDGMLCPNSVRHGVWVFCRGAVCSVGTIFAQCFFPRKTGQCDTLGPGRRRCPANPKTNPPKKMSRD